MLRVCADAAKHPLASGDCRHLVKTIGSLPSSYTGPCEAVINDKEMDIVARNAILLLIAFQFEPEVAAPVMLHLWYSAFVPAGLLALLKEVILPLVQDVCAKIESKPPLTLLSKTWTFENRTLRLALRKQSWTELLSYFDVPDGLTIENAENIRAATTLAPERRDYLDRGLFRQPPGQRVATLRFRHDGILLPFAARRDEYDTPNPSVSSLTCLRLKVF